MFASPGSGLPSQGGQVSVASFSDLFPETFVTPARKYVSHLQARHRVLSFAVLTQAGDLEALMPRAALFCLSVSLSL